MRERERRGGGQTWETDWPHHVSQQGRPLQSEQGEVVAGQDVAVLGGQVPARVEQQVLHLVAGGRLHLGHVSQAEVDSDLVRVDPVAAGRTGPVPR